MTQSVHPPAQPSAQVPTTDAPPAGASPSNNRGGKSTVSAASRWATFSHAVAFVVGFTIVFVLMGSAFGLLGANLQGYKGIISQLGAVLLLLFALVTMGVFGWAARTLTARVDLAANPAAAALVGILNWFNQLVYSERRVAGMHSVHHGWGLLSSFLIGVTFSAGWLPCIGPILSSILFLAGSSTTAAQGASLLLVYSLGLGIPFLLVAAFLPRLTGVLAFFKRHMQHIKIAFGLAGAGKGEHTQLCLGHNFPTCSRKFLFRLFGQDHAPFDCRRNCRHPKRLYGHPKLECAKVPG